MNDDEALAAVRWIESIDVSTADAATCEQALVVLGELRDRLDDALDHLVVRSKPPICSIHCHTPLRRMGP
ncbi:hypothetical protein [Ilumatobacter sp.]|uniref:hypothetical protein n=1 Tax=Ilumatobacter sp. TaxID=1967498 RepID=UPI003AF47DFB